jgi:hypothetical protein
MTYSKAVEVLCVLSHSATARSTSRCLVCALLVWHRNYHFTGMIMVCYSCMTPWQCGNQLQKFRSWSILAYECGYQEEDIALKLTEICDRGISPLHASKVPACIEGMCIVWETLEQSARPVRRWSQGAWSTSAWLLLSDP